MRAESTAVMVRSWADESVIYDVRRGRTHLLNPVLSCTLQELTLGAWRTLDDLVATVSDRLERSADADLRAEVEAAAHHLGALGLASSSAA